MSLILSVSLTMTLLLGYYRLDIFIFFANRLLENRPFKAELRARLIDAQILAAVEFRTTLEPAGRNCSLCKLHLRMPTQKIDSLSTVCRLFHLG